MRGEEEALAFLFCFLFMGLCRLYSLFSPSLHPIILFYHSTPNYSPRITALLSVFFFNM